MTWTAGLLALCAVAGVVGVGLLLGLAKRENGAAPDYRVVDLGGLQYESMLGRQIHPSDSVDASIIRGLPSEQRRLRQGQALFGAFVAVANDAPEPVPAASRIELRDEAGHVYRPLALPATNAYAYRARTIAPKTRLPGAGSAADDNLAATGYLLLFRIPQYAVDEEMLELVIHHPDRPAQTASLVV